VACDATVSDAAVTRHVSTRSGQGRHARTVKAVLFDRDGTLVQDVPHNGDPGLVAPMPGAAAALSLLRSAGIRVGVVSNQSAVGRGVLRAADVDTVNRRVHELLGPFDVWAWCPHTAGDGCPCRKPRPGLVLQAMQTLGVRPDETVVIGDIGSDVDAARAAGARGVLVPTAATRHDEVRRAEVVHHNLGDAVRDLLGTS
jgi:HAD superfamily hydrolase (TIGR01662 family)